MHEVGKESLQSEHRIYIESKACVRVGMDMSSSYPQLH